jgi:multidrug transporter EmrE-like cation transporter
MPWILLLLAALLEIAWAIGLKYTDGFTRLWPTVGTIAALERFRFKLTQRGMDDGKEK